MTANSTLIEPGAAISFLNEAAGYFARRPTNGEDSAYWANVANAETCRRIADLITKAEGLEGKEEGSAVSAAERSFVRHLIREMRAAIAANPEAPTITTGPLDPEILERVLNVALASQGADQ